MAAACLGLAAGLPASAADLLALPTRPGVTQALLVEAPATAPPWVILLFAGGDGRLAASASGPSRLQGNFLVRTAAYWPGHGLAAVLFDAPSDQPGGMQDAFRLSDEAAVDVAAAVAALRQRFPGARVALIGTSRGTVTVGNLLQRQPALADAYVLTSPVTQATRGNAGLSGLRWAGQAARVLVLANAHDACFVSPPGPARQMATDHRFDFVEVDSTAGGGDRVSDCQAQSPHGFLGIETQVLDRIAGWLQAGR